MAEIRYKVMAARLGEIDIRFRVNIGLRVIEVTKTIEWDGIELLANVLRWQTNLIYGRLLQIANGTNLAQYVGTRGTFTAPISTSPSVLPEPVVVPPIEPVVAEPLPEPFSVTEPIITPLPMNMPPVLEQPK